MKSENYEIAYAVELPVVFPEGFSIGSGSKNGNMTSIERNGKGMPVLRGTSVAGILRAKISQDARFAEMVEYYFGKALNKNIDRQESLFHFYDTEFPKSLEETMHNKICRHTGSVSTENKGLFSVERTAAGLKANLFFTLLGDRGEKDEQEDMDIIHVLAGYFAEGLLIGGNGRSGCGRCLLQDRSFQMRKFDLAKPEDAAAWLDLLYAEKKEVATRVALQQTENSDCFSVDLKFGLAEGQDLLCAEGNDMTPVSSRKGDGQLYWMIPGSTFRGIFKAWMSRLAAREGIQLSDSVENYLKCGDKKDVQATPDDEIHDLFGTCECRGRIHFTDAYSEQPVIWGTDIQYRTHVVIDRFTGGTNDGKFFSCKVLIDPTGKLAFSMQISIEKPSESELRWLAQTLRALDLGLIRIGSSKASGCLKIRECNVRSNPTELEFAKIAKGE